MLAALCSASARRLTVSVEAEAERVVRLEVLGVDPDGWVWL